MKRQSRTLRRSRSVSFWLLNALLLLWVTGSGYGQTGSDPLVLPSAVAFDGAGDLYVAETGKNRVLEYQAGGVLVTAAGTGVEGFSGDGGAATAAELDSPEGVAVDSAGNLYVADTHNNRIRKVAAGTGIISTVAGIGAVGYSGDGGAAMLARLDRPMAVAVTPGGDLYVADTGNNCIRRISAATGTISNFAGDGVAGFGGDGGAASSAELDSPRGLALDTAGNLLIADTRNGRLRRVDAATGTIATVAGAGVKAGDLQAFSGDGGAATAAGLALPRGVTVDAAGNVYVADSGNHRIRKISPAGDIATIAGSGTEGFAGDGSAAAAADLDHPRGLAMSPGGAVTLSDRGNGRIRQLDAASAPDIQTISAVTGASADTLSLSGPGSSVYGSGTVTATLSGASGVSGMVTLSNIDSVPAVQLESASLSGSDVATFSLSGLGVGPHTLVASYAGDGAHAAAVSQTFSVVVTPLALTVAPSAASVEYGQVIPTLTGSLSGVLPQDSGKVSAVFATSAVVLSPVGSYAIGATIAGPAAQNYALQVVPASLTITQAPSVTTVSSSVTSTSVGLPVLLTVSTTSKTSGVPTGTVSLLDGSTVLGSSSVSAVGAASFSIPTLSEGTHVLSATYTGDDNFLASSSQAAQVVVSAAPDFAMSSTGGSSESIPEGGTATFNFAVTAQGAALSSPILLAVQGVPTGATASLNPSSLIPGSASTSFTLTIQTPLARLQQPQGGRFGGLPVLAGVIFPVMGLGFWPGRRKPRRRGGDVAMALLFCITLISLVTGCGDRVNTTSEAVKTATYKITVTGTATGLTGNAIQHSANVTLEVL